MMVLTVDNAGIPWRWSTWQQAVCHIVLNDVLWSAGENTLTVHGGISKLFSQQSSITIPSIISVPHRGQHHTKPPRLTNVNLFKRDLNICAYCGRQLSDNKLTRDHVIPTSRGGENKWHNVVTACRGCNHKKDNKLLEEINMELLYVPYVPSTVEALVMENRRILADQMEFLSTMLPKNSRVRLYVSE